MKKIILAAAVAALASLAVASFASADVARYQTQSMTITATQPKDVDGQFTDVWTHTFNVTVNPCDGSFSGNGSILGTGNVSLGGEAITGQLNGKNTISFTATRDSDSLVTTLNNAPLDNTTVTMALANTTPIQVKVGAVTTSTTNYKNHGDYVSSQGGGSDAAHSCIGMPVK